MEDAVHARLSPAEGRRFAFPVGGAFAVLGAVAWWRGHGTLQVMFHSAAALLLAAGALVPGRLGPVYRGWMAFAHALSRVTTPVLMAVIFFVVVVPIGLAMRLAGRNPLVHRLSNGSHWKPRAPGARQGDLTRQF